MKLKCVDADSITYVIGCVDETVVREPVHGMCAFAAAIAFINMAIDDALGDGMQRCMNFS